MNDPSRDGLDFAIDRVAVRLVSVQPDELLADRIASRLPERSSNWFWLAPQIVGAIGVVLFAFVLFSNRATRDVPPIAEAPRQAAPSEAAPVLVEPPAVVATPIGSKKDPAVVQVDNTFDRDFGLTPVAPPREIALAAIAATSEIDVPAAELAPIVLTDLPMASDSPSPR